MAGHATAWEGRSVPCLPHDLVTGPAEQADDLGEALPVHALGRAEALVDLLLQDAELARGRGLAGRLLPGRRGGAFRGLPHRPPLAAAPAENALDVGQPVLDRLRDLLLPRVVGEPAIQDGLVAAAAEPLGVFREDAAEIAGGGAVAGRLGRPPGGRLPVAVALPLTCCLCHVVPLSYGAAGG